MRINRIIHGVAAILAGAMFSACQDTATTSPVSPAGAAVGVTPITGVPLAVTSATDPASQLTSIMNSLNLRLAGDGAGYRVAMAEAITAAESGEAGITVIAKDVGNKQLDFDFVPNDARRLDWDADPNHITYAIDQTGDAVPVFGGLTAAETDAAIVRGHATWEALSCSSLGQTRNDDFGLDIGLVAFLNGLGGSPFVFADIQHAGWRDIDFAGGVLGVTFTFGFVDDDGVFTDIDHNGKLDAAFREIYYDPTFSWADNGSSNVDVQSVAVHETGHGLSQAHFGKVFFKNNGSLIRSPLAVMNAIYSMPLRVLQGTDEGGHCSNWTQWPNN